MSVAIFPSKGYAHAMNHASLRWIISVLFVTGLIVAGGLLWQKESPQRVEPQPHKRFEQPELKGTQHAEEDWSNGIRRITLFGLRYVSTPSPYEEKLNKLGYEVGEGGCIFGDDHHKYWEAYNQYMITEGRKLFGDQFPATPAATEIPPVMATSKSPSS
jgi:hypothetical protein